MAIIVLNLFLIPTFEGNTAKTDYSEGFFTIEHIRRSAKQNNYCFLIEIFMEIVNICLSVGLLLLGNGKLKWRYAKRCSVMAKWWGWLCRYFKWGRKQYIRFAQLLWRIWDRKSGGIGVRFTACRFKQNSMKSGCIRKSKRFIDRRCRCLEKPYFIV